MQSVILPFIPVKVVSMGSRAVVKDVTPPNVSVAHFRTSESLSANGAMCVCGGPPIGRKKLIEVPFVTCNMDGNEFAFRIRYKIYIHNIKARQKNSLHPPHVGLEPVGQLCLQTTQKTTLHGMIP